ncbi:MAG: HAD family hydrolase, partial [Spirochaetes bacterium]|nr:HAD family hydrolase [Spirochaetota bacterium]
MSDVAADISVNHLSTEALDRESAILILRRRSAARSPRPVEKRPSHGSPVGPLLASTPARVDGIRAILFDIYGTLFVSASGDVGTALSEGENDRFTEALAEAVPHLVGMRARARDLPAELGKSASEAYFSAISRSHEVYRRSGIDHPEVEIRRIWEEACAELTSRGLLSRHPDPPEIERVALAYELRSNPVWPMPEAARTIKELAAAGYRLGVVSNAQFFTPLLFPALMGAEPQELGFDAGACVYSFTRGVAKPSSRLFDGPLRHLRDHSGIAPAEILYVGNDMRNDIL